MFKISEKMKPALALRARGMAVFFRNEGKCHFTARPLTSEVWGWQGPVACCVGFLFSYYRS